MTLVAEILGVLVGGVAIGSLLRGSSPVFGWEAGVAMVVAAVASLLFFANAWGLISPFPAATRANEAITPQAAEVAAGPYWNNGFLTWAREKIVSGPAAPTFYLEPETIDQNGDGATYQWASFELLPARLTDEPWQANWIVFYGGTPTSFPYYHGVFRHLIFYAPGFAVAKRTNVP